MYLNTQTNKFALSIDDVRKAHPESSVPDGVSFGPFIPYVPSARPECNPLSERSVETLPKQVGGILTQAWAIEPLPAQEALNNAAEARLQAWERIKYERDRRKGLGVKVGSHWFHSDDPSRIQQMALVMMGQGMPAGIQWKTLTLSGESIFVTMTPALASAIFNATALHDQAVFAAAEIHRAAMEAHERPDLYELSHGWPASIQDPAQ